MRYTDAPRTTCRAEAQSLCRQKSPNTYTQDPHQPEILSLWLLHVHPRPSYLLEHRCALGHSLHLPVVPVVQLGAHVTCGECV